MPLNITILDDKLSKTIEGFSSLIEYEIKPKLLAEVVRSELSNLRGGNAHTKTRAEVSGGGKKPWKQKGTGRARHGSTRSPIWVGGGITFGPRNTVNWSLKINKSARISALKTILKDRLESQAVYILPEKFEFLKTKTAIDKLDVLTTKNSIKENKIVIIYTTEEKDLLRGFASTSARLVNAGNLKIVNLAAAKNFVLTPKAKEFLENKVSA